MTGRARERSAAEWTPALLAITVLSLLWVYVYGISANPARWEEPRRCLVAMEMIASGDYVAPTVMGEIYQKKPPVYNWLIALAAGNRFEAADAMRARWVTLVALLLIAVLVWRLGGVGGRAGPSLLPAVIFLTMAVVVQLGRAGEIDIVFALFTTAALAAFEFGRRRGSPTLQWFVPQLFVAAGVLTKGLAPLFFYPPVLYCAWRFRGRLRFSPSAFLLGLAAMGLLVAAWVIPYTRSVPPGGLEGTGQRELLWVFVKDGLSGLLLHPVKYPLMVIGAAMPWTIYLFMMGGDLVRELRKGLRDDPYATLAIATVGWSVLLYLFVPGVAPRYLIPILPFVAVWVGGAIERGRGREQAEESRAERRLRGLSRHWLFWTVAVVILVGYALGGGWVVLGDPRVATSVAVGLPMIGAFAYLVFGGRVRSSIVPLLLLGLVYGVGFSGVWEARRARKTGPFVQVADRFATRIDESTPVVCDCPGGAGRLMGYNLSHTLGRPVQRTPPAEGAYFLVVHREAEDAPQTEPLAAEWRYGLWRFDTPGPVEHP